MSTYGTIEYDPPTPVEYSKYTSIMFIDSVVEAMQFSSYCNDSTYPLVYNYKISRESINQFISNFINLKRIAFAFHGIPIYMNVYQPTNFINNAVFFDIDESLTIKNTDNYLFVKGLIQQFSLTNIDFLGCGLLLNNSWRLYFESLQTAGNTIIGASDDDTGNIKYGGDWVMENTLEDIKSIYFNENVENYQYTLIRRFGTRGFIAVKTDGSIYSWGQIGNTPAALQQPGARDDISYFYSNTWAFIGVKNSGPAVIWGYGPNGGDPTSEGLANPADIKDISKVASGNFSYAVVKTDGSVISWGSSTNGGDSSSVQSQLTNVVNIYATLYSYAALKSDGTVVSWGPSTDKISDSQLTQMTNVVSIVANSYAYAALRSDGSVACGGNTDYGATTPSSLTGPTANVTKIVNAGGSFAALKSDGTVVCWGNVSFSTNAPSSVTAAGSNIVELYANNQAYVAIKSDRTVIHWTSLAGIEPPSGTTLPTDATIYSGNSTFLILYSDGTVTVWGYPPQGGDASSVQSQLTGVTKVAMGVPATAVLKSDGTVVCWGSVSAPSTITSAGSNVTDIYANGESFAALKSDGSVVAWGANWQSGNSLTTPVNVSSVLSSGVEEIFPRGFGIEPAYPSGPTFGDFTIPAKNFGDAPFNLTAPSSNSTGAITYTSSNSSVATVTSGGTVTIVGAGSTTITANQAASDDYTAGSVTATLVVSTISPTIGAFTIPADFTGNPPFNLTAPSSNSGGAFTYTSSNSSVATVTSGGTVTIIGAGSTTITATQAATNNYTSGSVTATFVVSASSESASVPISPIIEWTKQLGTTAKDNARGVAIDSNNNIYITGYTAGNLDGTNAGSDDVFLAKYDSAGTLVWTKQLGTSTEDRGNSVAIDSNNNVYVIGYTYGVLDGTNAGSTDAYIAKYDNDGTLVWTKQLGSSGKDDGQGVAIDSNDNVYIVGYTNGSLAGSNAGGFDIFLAKYNSSGINQWTKQLGTSGTDVSLKIALDSNNNAYITGYTDGNLGGTTAGSLDAFLAKYDSTGTLVWAKQLGTSGSDLARCIAIDSNNNVYIAGQTTGNLDGQNSGSADIFVAKYDSTGTNQWTRQLGTSVLDTALGVAVDSNNNVYITGYTDGNLDGTNAGSYDVFLVKYNSTGTIQWSEQLGSSASDESSNIAIDSNNKVYITGHTTGNLDGTNAGNYDAFLVKYQVYSEPAPISPIIEWTKQLGTTARDNARGVAIDSNNNIYITGYTAGNLDGTNAGLDDVFLAKYNSAGTLVWTKQLGTSTEERGNSVAIDSNNNVYVIGYTQGNLDGTNAGSTDAFFAKYDSTGTLVWTKQFGSSGKDDGKDIAIDSNGNVYIAGYTNGSLAGSNAGGLDIFLAKYNSSGINQWTKQLGTSGTDVSVRIALDSNNNAYITGYTDGNLGGTTAGSLDAFFAKYDSTGTLVWTKQLGTSGSDLALSIAIDSNNNVYIAGQTTGNLDGQNSGSADIFVAKYNSTGTLVWTKQLGTSGLDTAVGVALDSNNNVYITGYTAGNLDGTNAGLYDVYFAKYNSSGTIQWIEQLGTSAYDEANNIAIDSNNNVYIAGHTNGNLDGTNAGLYDVFLVKYQVYESLISSPTIGTLTVPAKNFGDAPFSLTSPSSNSTGRFSYTSSDTGVATVTYEGTVTIVSAGSTTITATQSSTADYALGSVTGTLVVSPISPTIGTLSVTSKSAGDPPFNLSAPSSNSGGAFTYTSSNTSVATVTSGGTVTMIGGGTTTITATQSAAGNYTSGSVSATLVVTSTPPTIGTLTVPSKSVGDPPFNLSTPSSNSGGAFTYTSSNSSVATVTSGGTVTIVGVGSTTITATQAAAGNYVSGSVTATLVVSLRTPTIGTLTIPSKFVGEDSFNITPPSSNSGGAFTFTSNNTSVATVTSGGTVTIVGDGRTIIRATQAAAGNYSSGSVTGTLDVYPLPPAPVQVELPTESIAAIEEDVPDIVIEDPQATVVTIPVLANPAVLTSGTATERVAKREVFFKEFFTKNANAVSGKTIKMDKEALLGTSSIISKSELQVVKAANTETPVDTSNLGSDEGIYAFIDGVGDFIVLQMGVGKKLKVEKRNATQYNIYEDYVDSNTPLTTIKNVGETGEYNGFGYQIGSFTGPIDNSLLPIAICFPCQTPVVTDQGEVHINKLKPNVHTIQGKRIISILETAPNFKHMVCIEKNALGNNSPSRRTEMSPDHKVQYNGQMIKAKDLVDVCEGVNLVPFIREKIYNVLMEQYDTIIVNNMVTETLHPDNILVQIATSKEYTAETKLELCKEYERLLMT